MRDIWAFLLQTLTASGVAVLLLIVKAMFRDKLSPPVAICRVGNSGNHSAASGWLC